MEIEKITEDGKITLHIKGRVDTQTAPELQEQLDLLFAESALNLVLDFKEVEYISSAGLRTVLYAQKRINDMTNSKMKLINVSDDVMDVLSMTGFTDFLIIE